MAKIPDGLPERMLNYRAAENIGQKELAQRCKVTVQTIGNIETGRRAGATALTLAKIERVVNQEFGKGQ